MNFFEHQQRARTSSRRLVALFALATVGIVVVLDLMVWLVLGSPELVLLMTVLAPVVIGVSSLVRVAMLRGGGAEVARSMGAVPVASDTTEPSLRRLRNVVEEISIAASVPMPQIFVMEEEAELQFAGRSPLLMKWWWFVGPDGSPQEQAHPVVVPGGGVRAHETRFAPRIRLCPPNPVL